MKNKKIQKGQIVRLTESVLDDEGHLFCTKGSAGVVIGRDGHLLKVRMRESQVSVVVKPHVLERM